MIRKLTDIFHGLLNFPLNHGFEERKSITKKIAMPNGNTKNLLDIITREKKLH